MKNYYSFLLIFTIQLTLCTASWGTPGSGQYHIQTDEGPERYFRYQTDNGQYRKEKRLQDGTVIGTDAWIDAAGFLRAKDYIADGQGYRILKSKTVYVGKNLPIDEAMKSVKNLPPQAGILAGSHRNEIIPTTYRPPTAHVTPIPSTTFIPISSTTPSPISSTAYNDYGYSSTPNVFVYHRSQPIEEVYGNSISHYDTITSKPPIDFPVKTFEPPFYDNRDRQEKIKPIAVISTTPSPISSTEAYGESTLENSYSTTSRPILSTNSPYSTVSPELYAPVSTYHPVSAYRGFYDRTPIASNDYLYESSTLGPIIPLDSNDVREHANYPRRHISDLPYRRDFKIVPLDYNNLVENGYDKRHPTYDGVSVTRNGFRYYLPKHYHEEDNSNPERRAGSFGYVDPFGIRRVIYYNTSPEEGFKHRKNNRYVGHNAEPYDPRPL